MAEAGRRRGCRRRRVRGGDRAEARPRRGCGRRRSRGGEWAQSWMRRLGAAGAASAELRAEKGAAALCCAWSREGGGRMCVLNDMRVPQ